MSKIILVTGANQGIGYELVRQLAQLGHTVYLGARSAEKGQEALAKLQKENLTTVKLLLIDVTKQESVDKAVKEFSSEQNHLDILINNAGVCLESYSSVPSNINIDVAKQTYETNLFGVMRVVNGFIHLIQKSVSPSILNISSSLGSISFTSDPNHHNYKVFPISAYNSSKSALNAYTVGLATSLPNVMVNVICPGYTSTNLNNYQGYLTPSDSAAGVIKHGVLIGPNGPNGPNNGPNNSPNGPTSKFLSQEGVIYPW